MIKNIKNLIKKVFEQKKVYEKFLPEEYKNKIFFDGILFFICLIVAIVTIITKVQIISALSLVVAIYLIIKYLIYAKYVWFGEFYILDGYITDISQKRHLSGVSKYVIIKSTSKKEILKSNCSKLQKHKYRDFFSVQTKRNLDSLINAKVSLVIPNKQVFKVDGINNIVPLFVKYSNNK